MPPYPTPGPAGPVGPPRTGVAFATVPKILLGTGAFCLLVAAVTFLAVNWSSLGAGARTGVLAGLTLTAGASALLLHRFGLRIAGESLIVVALGLLALDIFGAGGAGWIFDSADETGAIVTCIAGLVLTLAGLGVGVLRVGGQPRLVAPQIISGIGLVMAWAGAGAAFEHPFLVGHAATAIAVAMVLLARKLDLPALVWSHAVAGSLAWFTTAALALASALDEPSLHELWIDGAGWSLLATAAALLAPGLIARHRQTLLAGASIAAMVVTAVATIPCLDTDVWTVSIVALAVTAAWVLLLGVLPSSVRVITLVPSAVGSLILVGLSLSAGTIALARWGDILEPFDQHADVALAHPDPVTAPLLVIPSLLLPVLFVALLTPDRGRAALGTWLTASGVIAGVGLATTLASYDVALVLPLAALLLTALGSAVAALLSTGGRSIGFAIAAVVVALATAVGSLPTSVLGATFGLAAATLGLALVFVGRERAVQAIGGVGAMPAIGFGIAGLVYAVGGDFAWVAIPVLLTVGIVAVCRPRVEIEVSGLITALLMLPGSLAVTDDPGGYGALWLTVAGCLACASALIHTSRRFALWIGIGLFVLATWVRLGDLQVTAPEAYTLPLAVGLTGFGLWHLRNNPGSGTAETLLPGLLLGIVPSLLWVLGDPVTLRALILGTACLVLAIAGAAMRWSAPLVVGASAGAVVVLRELGAYPGDVPKWVWIAIAGALLMVVGVAWERRLLDIRKAVNYVGRLR